MKNTPSKKVLPPHLWASTVVVNMVNMKSIGAKVRVQHNHFTCHGQHYCTAAPGAIKRAAARLVPCCIALDGLKARGPQSYGTLSN